MIDINLIRKNPDFIKENIKNNPDMKCWQGIILVNSKEYHWRVTERDLNADNKEF